MRDHDGLKPVADEIAVRLQVVVEVRELALVHGKLRVRIAVRSGVRRKVLRRDRHAGLLGARGETARERRDGGGLAVQGAIADDLRQTAVEVDARREAQVDADRAQLCCHEPAAGAGRFERQVALLVVQPSQRTKRRQPEKRLTEPLHSPAFLIDGHEQRRLANCMNVGNELRELRDALEVTREKNHAANERRLSHSRSSAARVLPRKSIIKGPSDTTSPKLVVRQCRRPFPQERDRTARPHRR